MKTVLLVAGGRGGSDFFQGLLDGHKEILSFPGYLRIDQKFIDILNTHDPGCNKIAYPVDLVQWNGEEYNR